MRALHGNIPAMSCKPAGLKKSGKLAKVLGLNTHLVGTSGSHGDTDWQKSSDVGKLNVLTCMGSAHRRRIVGRSIFACEKGNMLGGLAYYMNRMKACYKLSESGRLLCAHVWYVDAGKSVFI